MFSPIPFLPSVLWFSLSFPKYRTTENVPASSGFRPLAALLLLWRPCRLCYLHDDWHLLSKNSTPNLLRPRGRMQPHRPLPLFMTVSAASVSQFSLRGLLLFEAFTSFKIFGSRAPYKKEWKEIYWLLKKYENVQPVESVVCHLPRNAFVVWRIIFFFFSFFWEWQ